MGIEAGTIGPAHLPQVLSLVVQWDSGPELNRVFMVVLVLPFLVILLIDLWDFIKQYMYTVLVAHLAKIFKV